MGKYRTLLEQKDYLNMNIGDMIRSVDLSGKSKYVELFTKLLEDKFNRIGESANEFIGELEFSSCVTNSELSKLKESNSLGVSFILRLFTDFYSWRESKDLFKFMSFVENNKIKVDVSEIRQMSDVSFYVQLAELSLEDKEIMEYIIKDYEDDEWLIVRPLSHLASRKYGAGSKWCTAATNDSHTFYDYTSSGCLIYIIKKTENFKVAAYKRLHDGLSFWNQIDNRIDSIESGLPFEILSKVKTIIDKGECNFDLLSDKQKDRVSMNTVGAKLYPTEELSIAPPENPLSAYNGGEIAINYTYDQPVQERVTW